MQILISCAKTMTNSSVLKAPAGTAARFGNEANEIAMNMAQYSASELSRILKVNPKIAAENYLRLRNFHTPDVPGLQAILAYTGVVFKNINPKDFTKEDFLFAQNHLSIGSFAYGLLRPLDLIKPYRMEHDVKLPELGDGNMYAYWNKRQTDTLIDDVQATGGILIYLASMEIQPLFDWKRVEKAVRVITPEFKVWKGGRSKTIVIYTKMARGQMSRYIIKNRISDPEVLKTFTWEGFRYNESLSEGDKWVFTAGY